MEKTTKNETKSAAQDTSNRITIWANCEKTIGGLSWADPSTATISLSWWILIVNCWIGGSCSVSQLKLIFVCRFFHRPIRHTHNRIHVNGTAAHDDDVMPCVELHTTRCIFDAISICWLNSSFFHSTRDKSTATYEIARAWTSQLRGVCDVIVDCNPPRHLDCATDKLKINSFDVGSFHFYIFASFAVPRQFHEYFSPYAAKCQR